MDTLSRRETLRLVGIGASSVAASGLAGCLAGFETGDSGSTGTGGDGGSTDNDGDDDSTDTDDDGSTDDNGGPADTDGNDGSGGGTGWQTATLTDVRTGVEFAIADFDRPVLVETFAIWCSNCKRQQDELVNFHEAVGDDVVSVALNTDQNEDAAAVREHAESNGYHWRYAISPPAVTRSLVDEFGASMTSPPMVPMVLRCPDGSATRLKDGHKSTSYLREQTDGC